MSFDLQLLTPDPARSARVVMRARQTLERRSKPRGIPLGVLVERVLVGGVALVYLVAVFQIAISIPLVG